MARASTHADALGRWQAARVDLLQRLALGTPIAGGTPRLADMDESIAIIEARLRLARDRERIDAAATAAAEARAERQARRDLVASMLDRHQRNAEALVAAALAAREAAEKMAADFRQIADAEGIDGFKRAGVYERMSSVLALAFPEHMPGAPARPRHGCERDFAARERADLASRLPLPPPEEGGR